MNGFLEAIEFSDNVIPEDEEILDFTYSITSYGADYPVDSLIKRLERDHIKIPKFQRDFVWSTKQASRFIESLLLGLPVPGIFLSKDTESADLFVIDGQQRLKSLLYFYQGYFNDKPFRLTEVQKRFEGKTYRELDIDDRSRFNDSIIHATIVKQDEPSEDNSSVFLIFERLNTGGVSLQPQEIRTAIYPGEFAELLAELNQNTQWRRIYGNSSKRMKDQEFILRFFAMYFYRNEYKKPLKGFLNKYMAKNRHLQYNKENELTEVFKITVDFLANILGTKAFRPKRAINASIFDSIMVGVAQMLQNSMTLPDSNIFLKAYDDLLSDPNFIIATTDATSDELVVERRMRMSINKFQHIYD